MQQKSVKKIINDPVHGFIEIHDSLILELINHPYFQRLRRINQLGLTSLVYPGATHSRFHHALGAMHLMSKALDTLIRKGVSISNKEKQGALMAILLHDIGHGPFSHVLEETIIQNTSHEELSVAFMEDLNRIFDGQLDLAIEIFKGTYPKHFLHQLVSGQLDMDRLDYLSRDSFYTGVSEGIVGFG
jgi:HD superfamily phosphohydrolase